MTATEHRAGWAIGTAVLGRPAYLNTGSAAALPDDRSVAAMRARLHEVLDAAVEAGIDWIDTARSYGRAEEFVAQWLGDRSDSASLTLSSKWGYAYVGDWQLDAPVHEVKEHTVGQLERQWSQSSALLGGHLDLYQVHSLTVDSPLFGDDRLLGALAVLRDAGMALGFSTSGPAQAEAVRRGCDLMVGGEPLFTAVQSTWNALEPSVGEALAQAHAAGRTVLVKEALANGLLASDPPVEVARIAEHHRVGPDAVALALAAEQPWADRVLLGPASVGQLEANLAAGTVQLTQHDREALASLVEEPETYWQRRSGLSWQ